MFNNFKKGLPMTTTNSDSVAGDQSPESTVLTITMQRVAKGNGEFAIRYRVCLCRDCLAASREHLIEVLEDVLKDIRLEESPMGIEEHLAH